MVIEFLFCRDCLGFFQTIIVCTCYFGYSFDNEFVVCCDGREVFIQSEPELAHAEVEYDACL